MRLNLQCHSDTPSRVVTGVSVSPILRRNKSVELIFRVEGDVSTMVWPALCNAERTDGLWQTTCFEMFVLPGDGPSYQEYNFSPSSSWAAYQFTDHRDGMRQLNLPHPPDIEGLDIAEPGIWELQVSLRNPPLTDGDRCGFSAVVEEEGGHKSYWALAHPSGQPDFHHRDCFVHKLRAT
ncbi:MAG: DOMON-like domain-containing protein [Pseudomonadota bacterium]